MCRDLNILHSLRTRCKQSTETLVERVDPSSSSSFDSFANFHILRISKPQWVGLPPPLSPSLHIARPANCSRALSGTIVQICTVCETDCCWLKDLFQKRPLTKPLQIWKITPLTAHKMIFLNDGWLLASSICFTRFIRFSNHIIFTRVC